MAEIIASLLIESPHQVRPLAARAVMAGADLVELRLDHWPVDEPLGRAIAAVDVPVILSCRVPGDGGHYTGTLEDRRRMFQTGLDAGAHGVDLEDWETWAPRSCPLVIRSLHDLGRVPDNLTELRDRLLDSGDVAKIACVAHDLTDAAPLFELLASSDPEREPTVAFAMGDRVAYSRVLACLLGSPYVYASVSSGMETAPGQLPVDLLAGLYRVRGLSTKSWVSGLVGDPARHSLGPWLHNRALRAAGLDAVYLPFETSEPRDLLAMLPLRRTLGLSVTAPHKETFVSLCHRLTPAAEAVGAVNTVTFDASGVLVGHNTDVAGVRVALERAGLTEVIEGDVGVVVGGGGAARAAAIALRDMGMSVMVMARTLGRIRDWAKGHGFVVAALKDAVLEDSKPRVVVHATPVGGIGAPPDAPRRLLPAWTPDRGCYVLDMNYRPRRTPLLEDVEAAGGIPVSGIEMFLAQAAEQVECFAGEEPDVADLRDYLAGATGAPVA